MDWGNGDGIVGGSPDYGVVINRNTEPAADFKQSWFAVQREGPERKSMWPYLPYLVNLHDKARFGAFGCPVDTTKIDALIKQ